MSYWAHTRHNPGWGVWGAKPLGKQGVLVFAGHPIPKQSNKKSGKWLSQMSGLPHPHPKFNRCSISQSKTVTYPGLFCIAISPRHACQCLESHRWEILTTSFWFDAHDRGCHENAVGCLGSCPYWPFTGAVQFWAASKLVFSISRPPRHQSTNPRRRLASFQLPAQRRNPISVKIVKNK